MSMYLHVWITVEKAKVDRFAKNAEAFLATRFLEDQHGWQLVAAMEVDQSSGYVLPVPPVPDSVTFVNVWALPENFDIARVMFQLSEFGPYVRLDNDVSFELQQVIYRVNAPVLGSDQALAQEFEKADRFAMVRHYPFRENLAEFGMSSGALAERFAKKAGLKFGGTYQNITGLLNEFWEIWAIGAGKSSADVRELFKNLIVEENNMVGESYRHSIDFKTDDPDDGILVLNRARFWK